MPQNNGNPFNALANAIARITRAANSGNAGQAAARGARGLNASPNRQVQQGGGGERRGGGVSFLSPDQVQGISQSTGPQGSMFSFSQLGANGYGAGGGNAERTPAEKALFDNPLAYQQMQMDAAELQENGSDGPSYEYKRTTISHPVSGQPKTPDSWGRVYYNEDGDKFAESTDADTGTTTTRFRPSPDGTGGPNARDVLSKNGLMDSAMLDKSSGSNGGQAPNAKKETSSGETESSNSTGEGSEGSQIPNAQTSSNPYVASRQKPVVNADLPATDTSALAQADARIRRMNIDAMSGETQPMVDRMMTPASDWDKQRLATSLRVGNDVPGMADVSGRGIVIGDKPPITSDVDKATQYQLANPQNEFESRVLQDQLANTVSDRALSTDASGREIPKGSGGEIREVLDAEKYNPGSASTEEKRQALDEMSAEDFQNAGAGENGVTIDPETGQPVIGSGAGELADWNAFLLDHPEYAERYGDIMDFKINGDAGDWYTWVMDPRIIQHYSDVDPNWSPEEFENEWFNKNEAMDIASLMARNGEEDFYRYMGYDPAIWGMLYNMGLEGDGTLNYGAALGVPNVAEATPEEIARLIAAEKAMAAYGMLQSGDTHGWSLDDWNSIYNPLGYEVGTGEGYSYDDGTDYLNVDPNKVSFGNWWEAGPAGDYLMGLPDESYLNAVYDQSTLNDNWGNENAYNYTGLPTAYTTQALTSANLGLRKKNS